MMNPQGALRLQSDANTLIYLENWTAKTVDSEATSVVLVHGGPGLFGYLGDLAQTLGSSLPTWTYFQRGRKFSETSGPITVAAHISDLKCVLQKIGGKPIVVGHSWGALLAAMTLLEQPQLARKLVMVGPMPFDAVGVGLFVERIETRLTPAEREARSINMGKMLQLTDYAEKNAMFRAMSEVTFKTYQRHPTLDNLSTKIDGYDVDAFFSTHTDLAVRMGKNDLLPALRDFMLPVEMIYGDYDPSPCQRLAGQLGEVLARFKVNVIADSGHYPWWEAAKVQKSFYTSLAQVLQN